MPATTRAALAVLALQVDGQAEIGVRWGDSGGLAVDLGVVPIHVRELLDRLHQRVAQQVGEGDLAAAGALELVVDDDAVVDHQLGRDGAHTGRRRHVQRRRHVLDDGRRGAAQRLQLVAFRRRGSGGFRRPRRDPIAARPCWRGRWARRAGWVAGPPEPAGRGRGRPAGHRCWSGRPARLRWRARGCSRPGTRASSDRLTRGRRGTCGTSPRPAIRSARMVNLCCSRPQFASILLFRKRLPVAPAPLSVRDDRAPHTQGGPHCFRPIKANLSPPIRQVDRGARGRPGGPDGGEPSPASGRCPQRRSLAGFVDRGRHQMQRAGPARGRSAECPVGVADHLLAGQVVADGTHHDPDADRQQFAE